MVWPHTEAGWVQMTSRHFAASPSAPAAACGKRGVVLLDLQELIFTARRVGGGEAQKLGLVDHCVDAGRAMDRALELARDISQVRQSYTAYTQAVPTSLDKCGVVIVVSGCTLCCTQAS